MMESDTETPYLYMELRCGDEPVKPNMSLLSGFAPFRHILII